jgi:hypothetical protein
MTHLEQREIEAKILAPVVRAFEAELGEERAREILADVIRNLARQSGCDAREAVGGAGLPELRQVVKRWQKGGALELDVLCDEDEAFDFNVTRCQYAEMYQRLGIPELGPILSCSRDAAMIDGFNPEIEFRRTQTLMMGAPHCDFRYRCGQNSPPQEND